MAAALKQFDLDVVPEHWSPPASVLDLSLLPGIPPHGIGRPYNVGKEGIVGLLTALELFLAGVGRRSSVPLAGRAPDCRWFENGSAGHSCDRRRRRSADCAVVALTVTSGSNRTASDLIASLQKGRPMIRQRRRARPERRLIQLGLPETGRGQDRRRLGCRAPVRKRLAGSSE
jgi:D-glucosaminate-6-phosphate ammonia-lyase